MLRVNVFLKSLVVGCLILGTASFCYGDNLFTDPSFDINGVHGWSQYGFPFQTENTVVHTGAYSAKNKITTVTDNDYYGQIYQVFWCNSGDPVYMSAYVKTNLAVGSTARAGILVEFFDNISRPTGSIKTDMGGVNDWCQIYVTGHAPAGTQVMRASAFIYAQEGDTPAVDGEAYIDDCSIDKVEAPGGIITNPGFENVLSGWSTYGGETASFVADSNVQHSGTYSAYDTIEDFINLRDYWSNVYQEEAPVTGGTPIYASAWGKSDISELSTAKGGLVIQFFNSSGIYMGTPYDLKSEIGGRTDWRQLYVAGTVPAGAAKMRIGGYLWAKQYDTSAVGGKFYIDDFVVSTDPIPPPPPQSDIINGDFENGVNDWKWNLRPFVATNITKHAGSFAAQHTIGDTTDPTNDYLSEIYQEIPYAEGQAAFVNAWVKTNIDPVKTAVGGIKIQFFDAAGQPITGHPAVQSDIRGQRDWSLLYVNDIAPAGTAKLRITGLAWATKNQGTINGNVYIDDINLSDTPPSDLILNPGFENALSGWNQDPDNFRDIESTDEQRYSESYSAKATIVDTDAANEDYWSRIYQEFDFTPGKQIYSTVWAKTNIDPVSHATAGLQVEFLNSSGVPIGTAIQDYIAGQTGWTYLYAQGTSPDGTAKVRISCFVSCLEAESHLGGTAYFDDVVASLDPLPQPEFPTGLTNGGFEPGLNDWTDLYGPPSETDPLNPRSGLYSAKKTIVAIPDEDYYSIIYQDIYYNSDGTAFPSDKIVYLTAYAKSAIQPAANARVGIKLEVFIDGQDDPVEIGKDDISATNNWRKLYIKALIPAGARKVRASGFAWAKQGDALALNGTGNFDDFVYSYSFQPAPTPQATLLNPGFENGLNEWKIPFGFAFVTANPIYSGSYAAEFLIDSVAERNYYGEIRQDVAVKPGQQVTAKVWAKTEISPMSSPGTKASLKIYFLDADGMFIDMHGPAGIGGNKDWTQLSTAGKAPTKAAKVSFRCYLYAPKDDAASVGGKAYFDGATLTITTPEPQPGTGCFLAGTPITMADGTIKPIEKIVVGDNVLAYDQETKQMKPDKVTQIFQHDKEDIYLVINGELKVTPIHRFLSKGNWVEIGKLKVGETLTNPQGEDVAIKTIEVVKEKVDIYNFEVNPCHTYVAGGFVVHNRKPIPAMADFQVEPAVILDNKKLTPTKITSIITDNSPVDVYNLEVSKTHNYFADGCLVHNKIPYKVYQDCNNTDNPRQPSKKIVAIRQRQVLSFSQGRVVKLIGDR